MATDKEVEKLALTLAGIEATEAREPATKSPSVNVEHPEHYNQGNIEVIDVIDDWDMGFYEATILRYLARAKYTGNEVEDLEKAQWYLNRLVENRLHLAWTK